MQVDLVPVKVGVEGGAVGIVHPDCPLALQEGKQGSEGQRVENDPPVLSRYPVVHLEGLELKRDPKPLFTLRTRARWAIRPGLCSVGWRFVSIRSPSLRCL